METELQESSQGSSGFLSESAWPVAGGIAGAVALVFAYWAVIGDLGTIWITNQDYSHGLLVAPFAVYLAWRKRGNLVGLKPAPSWIGAAVLVAAVAMRVVGVRDYYGSLERYSLVVAIAGLVLLLYGRRITWLMKGPLLFLVLMVPPPNRVADMIAMPLQRLTALGSAGVLNVMGWDAASEGNIIRLYGQDLEVAAACNGLRMVFAIVTLGCAMAYLARRPRWERILVACSSVLVGVAVNVVRIVATGVVSQLFVGWVTVGKVHDVAGWLMMPVALMFIWWEQGFLRSLFVEKGPLS